MKWIFILILFINSFLANAGGFGIAKAGRYRLSENTHPKNGMIGFTIGGLLPSGEDGHIFAKEVAPHAEFGVFGGLDFWKKYPSFYDFHIGLQSKYQQYHFHYTDVNEYDGYFRFWHLTAPITVHYPLRNYPYIFLKGGIALSTTNFVKRTFGEVNNIDYAAEIFTAWKFYPEVILGFDFLEEGNKNVLIRAGVDYSFIPISNMGEYEVYLLNGGGNKAARGHFKTGKFQLRIDIYPIWQRKHSVSDSKRCPRPF